jgi:hypothetical protein
MQRIQNRPTENFSLFNREDLGSSPKLLKVMRAKNFSLSNSFDSRSPFKIAEVDPMVPTLPANTCINVVYKNYTSCHNHRMTIASAYFYLANHTQPSFQAYMSQFGTPIIVVSLTCMCAYMVLQRWNEAFSFKDLSSSLITYRRDRI